MYIYIHISLSLSLTIVNKCNYIPVPTYPACAYPSHPIPAISWDLAHHPRSRYRGTHKFIVCFRHGAKPRNAALVSLPAAWYTGTFF